MVRAPTFDSTRSSKFILASRSIAAVAAIYICVSGPPALADQTTNTPTDKAATTATAQAPTTDSSDSSQVSTKNPGHCLHWPSFGLQADQADNERRFGRSSKGQAMCDAEKP